MSIFRAKLLIATVIIFAFLGSFYSHKLRAPKRGYSDFHCFYIAGKRILNQQNIYIIRDKETAEFRYAPIFAIFMSGLALLNEKDADTVWFTTNFCLLILSFILLKRLIIPEKLDFRSGLILYILTLPGLIRFIFHNFDTGQPNILIMLGIFMGLYYIFVKKREMLGGAIFAFSIMIKYTPFIFVPYFILRRKIKLSFIITISIIIYLILPSLFIGFKANFVYIRNLIPFLTNSTILDQMTILDPKNQSLFSFIHRIFTNCILYFYAPPMPFQSLNLSNAKINFIFITLAIIIYFSILYQPKNTRLNRNILSNNIDYALLLICVILFNLNAWMHNYILLSMGYFIIVHYLIKTRFKDKIVLTLWLLSYALNIITLLSMLGKTITYKLHFYSPLTISALIAFLALLKIRRGKGNPIEERPKI